MYYRDIDRMYRIETKGYNKVVIAKNYLWPKIRKPFNSTADGITIPNEIIEYNVCHVVKKNRHLHEKYHQIHVFLALNT